MEIIKYYNLMEGDKPPNCTSDLGHSWLEVEKPSNFRGGWHRDKCLNCGIEVGYDTSD